MTDTVAATAAIALLLGVTAYLWMPKAHMYAYSLTAFMVLTLLAAALILNTGGHSSPLLALWMIIAVFSGVFGWAGLLPILGATMLYPALVALDDTLTQGLIITTSLAGGLPLVFSYIIWHTKSTLTNGKQAQSYSDLATELSEVANKSEVVINAIADGVIAVNSKGVIQLINPAAQQIIGWGKQDALSLDYKSVLKLLNGDGHEIEPSLDPVSQVLTSNEKTVRNDLQIATNSDKKLMVSISVSPVGQLGSGVIVVFRDITKEKAEERAQVEFISTASHEMRTPVATIEGYLGLALNPATAQIDEKARDFIGKAHESAQHLGRLFADLLDISKAEDGRLTSTPKVVDIVAFTETVSDGLRHQAEAKGLVFLYKPLPEGAGEKAAGERRLNPVFYANVDNDHLREVVTNLIENAIKYTPKGNVTIDVNGTATHVTISVSDSGIGIPKEDQGHLFQKFYRVDNTDTREIGGTGLGLYLSRRLVESMGGRLWVESEYKQGSTFYLELPRVSHEEAMRAIETEPLAETEIQTYTAMPLVQENAQAPTELIEPQLPIEQQPTQVVESQAYQQPTQPAEQSIHTTPYAQRPSNPPVQYTQQEYSTRSTAEIYDQTPVQTLQPEPITQQAQYQEYAVEQQTYAPQPVQQQQVPTSYIQPPVAPQAANYQQQAYNQNPESNNPNTPAATQEQQ